MKTWKEAKLAYLNDHLSKPLKAPDIRLRSLDYIESAVKNKYPELLEGDKIFTKFKKVEFEELYAQLKGRRINSADKSVIHGLYKFSV
ncbi:MAG: hypothetical protein IPP48_16780 [Chitinophagaceae bacterium]|nr:hypothetical protein [Chitinophagaceae bacterium]